MQAYKLNPMPLTLVEINTIESALQNIDKSKPAQEDSKGPQYGLLNILTLFKVSIKVYPYEK